MEKLFRVVTNYLIVTVAVIVVLWSLINGLWIVVESGVFF